MSTLAVLAVPVALGSPSAYASDADATATADTEAPESAPPAAAPAVVTLSLPPSVLPAPSTPDTPATPQRGVSIAEPLRERLRTAAPMLDLGSLRAQMETVVDGMVDDTAVLAGDRGMRVALLQQRLSDLGYRPGPTDGQFGAQTASALLAFQKFESLDRDQVASAAVFDRLAAPLGAGPRSDLLGARVEIDLVRQVLIIVEPSGNVVVLNTSTGGNYSYVNPRDGSTNIAYTPTGTFTTGYRYDGLEVAPLGELYRPIYFYGGWAIHGSTSVPAYPASHGCARTSFVDQDWIWETIPGTTPVYVY